jgi:ethanolamine utilization cobalamin adenosyltransferase
MLFGETEVKANIRNRDGKRVFYLGKGDQLTSSAKDYLSRERIPILPGEQARPARYRLPGGGYREDKPEHMTHLHGDVLVPKTHPRIAFRGAVDMLEAEMILCQPILSQPWSARLGEVLEYVRLLLRCEVLEQPVTQERIWGLTAQQIRERSHRPQDYYGQAHFMPDAGDPAEVLALNRVRCVARQAELAAAAAFSRGEGEPDRKDILQAMNRVSSLIWILMIQMKKESRERG